MEKKRSVCVTGAAGYIGSCLVNKLLQKGYFVHATLRKLDDLNKVGLLKSLEHADKRLSLYEADIYEAEQFEAAVQGCEYVFHVATPMLHYHESTKFKDSTDAAIAGVKSIVECCKRLGTVKRLIYTGSVTAASPLKDDGSGFKDYMDELCWTPLHLSVSHSTYYEQAYMTSKTQSEEEILKHSEKGGLEVVSLTCALVGGGTLLPYLPSSVEVVVSQLSRKEACYKQLKWLQMLLGSVPLVHISDVCEAHVFCIEQASMSGRFLCAQAFPTIVEMANYFIENYEEFKITKEFVDGGEKGISGRSSKLTDMGFQYEYSFKRIMDDSVDCAKKMGVLK